MSETSGEGPAYENADTVEARKVRNADAAEAIGDAGAGVVRGGTSGAEDIDSEQSDALESTGMSYVGGPAGGAPIGAEGLGGDGVGGPAGETGT